MRSRIRIAAVLTALLLLTLANAVSQTARTNPPLLPCTVVSSVLLCGELMPKG